MKQRSLVLGSILTLVIIITGACSPYKKGILNTTFHNTTAHYNAEFIAKERLLEIENNILDQQNWDYTRILPVFPQFDTVMSKSLETEIEDCIKKASLIIQYHPNSKWVDNAYTIVGKARFYQSDFQNAIETFKYVNTKGEGSNEKHEALVALMRTFIENLEYNNAQAVSDYLKKEKLNKKNLKELYLTRAYFEQKRENIESCVKNLVLAEPLIDKKAENSRIRYTIGQIFQELGEDKKSFTYYKRCLKGNPPYELTFFTKLNMAQVTTLSSGSDESKIRKYFKKLLKDLKNEEYKDKIYYEYARFETRKGNLKQAILNYQKSIEVSTSNQLQKSFSYLGLGKLYYDSLQNYPLASAYYDSAVAIMPATEKLYPSVKNRQEVLSVFVENYIKVTENDSLLQLSEMDTIELYVMIDEIIEEKKKVDKANAKIEKRRQASANNGGIATNFGDGEFNAISLDQDENGTWYFYNTTAITTGYNSFQRVWGNRVLEDNWRRSVKEAIISEEEPQLDNENNPDVASTQVNQAPEQEEAENPAYNRTTYLAKIPFSPDEKKKALDEVEDGLYNLGRIYNFSLDDKENSIKSYEGLVTRFDTSEYRPESLYSLYLLYREIPDIANSDKYKNELINNYPDDVHSKLIDNPNYREDNRRETKRLKQEYAIAYRYYHANDFDRAHAIITAAMKKYPENSFIDHLAMLDVIIVGKTKALHEYQYELNKFIGIYPEGEMNEYAKKLLKATETYKFNLINSATAKYTVATDTSKYYFIVADNSADGTPFTSAQQLLEGDFKTLGLTMAPVLLDKNTSITLIKTFENLDQTTSFYDAYISNLGVREETKSSKFYYITKENFTVLYETKELDAYEKFFKKEIYRP